VSLAAVGSPQRDDPPQPLPVLEWSVFYVIIFSLLAVLLVVAGLTLKARDRRQLAAEHSRERERSDAAHRRKRSHERSQSRDARRRRH
jgi:hypothetical protein